ncbi:hypothetical protein [Rhizobium sp. CF122]|uniref:hypothetical protein n=1 Tax=Rhizobium sp. CF122 TaxID=1144312 RepID=UPI0002DBA2A2|nr:hypothetical protein [Rhizobium sp. CF122]
MAEIDRIEGVGSHAAIASLMAQQKEWPGGDATWACVRLPAGSNGATMLHDISVAPNAQLISVSSVSD